MKRSIVTRSLTAAALIASARGQQVVSAPEARARDLSRLFYSDTLQEKPADAPQPHPPEKDSVLVKEVAAARPPQPPPAPQPPKLTRRIGLKYHVLLQGAHGDVRLTTPSEPFHSGDRIRIQIESNVDGYLYIFQKGSSGRESTLFPDPEINGGFNQVSRGVLYSTPEDSWFAFDHVAGEERLLAVVSRTPLDWTGQEPVGTPGSAPSRLPNQTLVSYSEVRTVLDRSVSSRDLVLFDQAGPTVHGQTAPAAQARIAVNNSDQHNDLVYVEIVLKHL